MTTDEANQASAEHDTKVKAGEDKLQAQSEQKLAEMSGGGSDSEQQNDESKPTSAQDDQPDDPDPS